MKITHALQLGFIVFALNLQAAEITIQADQPGVAISPDLFGIFFEDLNYAADGGLYAELIQNRSFEYQATEQPTWNPFSFWELTKRGGGEGGWVIEDVQPLHPNNPHYLLLNVGKVGDGVGLVNPGFDGIALKAGETYDVSFFARQIKGSPMPVIVRLESKDGQVLGEASLQVAGREWQHLTAAIIPSRADEDARFVLLAKSVGGIALDEISLFPRNTFHNRPNGLRADLAQVIADLHPKFVRFPGGCLAHGDGIQNFYRWKDTIGPIEQRRGQKNIWRYHQSVGLGYFEYFQFCEDIGAKPLPILPAAVSCQNSDHSSGLGQQCVSIEDMPAYIQDVLDLIEWANGPATSKWGAKRAEAGHPEPFHLQYLGIGNEDKITSGFKERFKMIYDAVKAKHPEITVVGTVGPAPDGEDFNLGWKFADDLHVPIVDEHYYKPPEWFFANRNRYDAYDRAKPHVYVGEYAAHDIGKHVTFRSALAEAAYMTSLERNGDVVRMSSFAPLLARRGHTQWNPDLIYFTGTTIAPTISYYVQQMFCSNAGDTWLPTTVSDPALAVSTVRDSISGDLILKIVNPDAAPKPLQVALSGAKKLAPTATKTVLAETNPPQPIGPQVSTLVVGPAFNYEAPPNSLTVIRMKSQSR